MPRIVPIQLLKCLKVLLDDNGGILSAGEVKRLASLMTKYSKKLVSKCIYVQILKCTKTELLGEFMGAGGWSLVYTWLNDAIRAMNWPLVQEILELLLLCPVDVNRLKINSAPKLVKGLCKDGGNEGVRILAKRLVEQWLKVVTENPEATLANSTASAAISTVTTAAMTPQASAVIKTPPVAVVAPIVTPASIQQTAAISTTTSMVSPVQSQQLSAPNQKSQTVGPAAADAIKASAKAKQQEIEDEEDEQEEAEEECQEEEEQDPLGGVQETTTAAPSSYGLTPAQKKASESGLVYKIVVKNGNQFLAKVPKPPTGQSVTVAKSKEDEDEEEEMESEDVIEEDEAEADVADEDTDVVDNATAANVPDTDDNCSLIEKTEKENDSNSGNEEDLKSKSKPEDVKKSADKKSSAEDKEKTNATTSTKERRSSKEKERRSSSNGLEKEKDKDKEKEKEKEKDKDSKSSKSSSSSSSSSHRSSSHKSSSSSSKSSSSSSSKSKSSSSSSHRSSSSSDKHKSDKEKEKERSSSSSSKDKDRSSSSGSSSKHRSSSSKSSGYTSSISKDKYREKDKNTSTSSTSSSSSKNKDNKERDTTTSSQSDKDKSSSSSSSLPKIPKKPKEENDADSASKPTSITIPSKKASMSIEIRKDTEKSKTVKTYKSQFRSHGLTEEAPPPPSRKGLKKPSQPSVGAILPTSLPSSLKRSSPPPRDSPTEKKAKIDINNVTVANEKPGAIKLIPPKKIQTLVETNLFSDALSAATGPKKVNKRKRSTTPAPTGGKDGAASPPTSPAAESPKVMPLKFYQDTLDESKSEDSKSDKENEDVTPNKSAAADEDSKTTDKYTDNNDDDDDDIPLKKVKEDIEQKVALEKKMDVDANVADITKEVDDKEESNVNMDAPSSPNDEASSAADMSSVSDVPEVKKPGPGCGPNGPPGVLMLHRRKGPKKKLTWRPQETLEQVRFFELDENERCNVTKTSFMDMKNLERFNERDAIVLARRGFNQEDNMEPTTSWKTLIEVDEVPPHPEGNQSKQRKIQAEREMTTLRALYFTHALIPDSPAEAEIEPIFNHDTPLIPLDDLTGNPDAVNDFTSMPWPEPRGSPKHGDSCMAGTGGLGSPVDIFGAGGQPQMMPVSVAKNNGGGGGGGGGGPGGNPFNPFINSFPGNQGGGPNGPTGPPMQNGPQGNWQRPPNGMSGNGPMMGNPFVNNHGSPIMDMMGGPRSGGGGPGPGHMMNNGPPQNFNNQNFNNQFSPNNNQFSPNNNPFGPPMNGPPMNGPPMGPFGGGPPGNNFGPMGPGGPMVPPHMMNGMGPGPMMGNNGPPMMNGPNNNRNNGGNWRSGGPNFQDNNGGGGGGNWRPAGPGPNNRGGNGGGGGGNGNNNNGVCKAFMRGHCRLGKSCKYVHPSKGKRI